MGIEGMDGLLLLFAVIACAARGHIYIYGFPNFVCPLQKDKSVPSTFLDAAEFSEALECLHIVFGTHMEALNGY